MRFRFHFLLSTALTIAAPNVANAQADAATQSGGGIADIVVTAQRRAERLQDVPIAVSAVTAGNLAQRGITDLTNLESSVPGLNVSKNGATAIPFLRGVGSNAANPNNEPSVALYVDGIYIGAPFSNLFGFNNIDRIEVLKGPQGTLFGRNATGGVVQIITRTPSHDTSVEAQAGYANYDTISLGAYGTTGLSETVAVDLAIQYRNQRDGWGRNITLDVDNNRSKEFSARSKLLFTPTDRTKITLAGDYSYNRNSYTTFHIPKGSLGLDGLPHYYGPYDSDVDTPTIIFARARGASLTIEQDLDFATLVSTTARRLNRGRYAFDRDGTNIPAVIADLRYHTNTWSQELQLVGEKNGGFVWQVGGFYFKSVSAYDRADIITPDANGVLTTTTIYGRQPTKSFSLYGQATWQILPGTEITGGLRYTDEKQRAINNVNGFVFPDRSQGFNKLTWRAAINQTIASDVKVYASYNRGVKSGGYDLLDPTSAGFKPEILDAYEIGLKSDLFDRHVRLNLAAFYYDYRDIQVTAVRNQLTATFNAAAATIKGAEMDLTVAPVRGLTINAGASYLHGRYKDFPNPVAFNADGSAHVFPNNNAKGRTTNRTPKFTGSLGANYEFELAGGNMNLGANAYYNDGFVFDDVAGRLRQRHYQVVNGAMGWTTLDERFGISLWVRNIFNKIYLSQAVTGQLGDIITNAEPRVYGVTANVKF
ncbi:iron complex outermembrane recepter protein [Sphingobium faniae]|nr:iron complex outermembrane recepter protein [Sphingobium faniae]